LWRSKSECEEGKLVSRSLAGEGERGKRNTSWIKEKKMHLTGGMTKTGLEKSYSKKIQALADEPRWMGRKMGFVKRIR